MTIDLQIHPAGIEHFFHLNNALFSECLLLPDNIPLEGKQCKFSGYIKKIFLNLLDIYFS